jgi:hypothetical protein
MCFVLRSRTDLARAVQSRRQGEHQGDDALNSTMFDPAFRSTQEIRAISANNESCSVSSGNVFAPQ